MYLFYERETEEAREYYLCVERERFQVLKDKHKEGMPSWLQRALFA
ncbi:hypothetical protein COLO4_28219 [Corchorus olitorius]|uniref:Uncharacterized protein n=1 Tax=Corchorus olitorius TaxID=93759 RepID=A0A1R3HME8_9ROSI|nr:hypothetical protein COLO4_28219 [Corchorus olitorius]